MFRWSRLVMEREVSDTPDLRARVVDSAVHLFIAVVDALQLVP